MSTSVALPVARFVKGSDKNIVPGTVVWVNQQGPHTASESATHGATDPEKGSGLTHIQLSGRDFQGILIPGRH
jgi:hypothetical protein